MVGKIVSLAAVMLATVMVLTVSVRPARAQIMVMDNGSITQSIANTAREVFQLTQQYNMFKNVPDVFNGMLSDFKRRILQHPLPSAEEIVDQITADTGKLSQYAQHFAGLNRYVVSDQDKDPISQFLRQGTASLANIRGLAMQNLTSLDERLNSLNEMQETLRGATDITQVAAINGRIAVESQAVQAQMAEAQNLQTLSQAQMANQQMQERLEGRADELKAADWWKRGN
ncbi:type IV secretion system protein [Bombella mellum]|nr:type IV secretion system protein [Bombella mellum]